MDADVIVVGAGLAGLVATAELADAGKKVLLLDQEPEPNLGGQAFWSFGGLFLSTRPSSAGWASGTPTTWPCRTGWAAPGSTAASTTRRRGLLGAPVGHGLRRLRRRREAGLAARDGRALVPGGRLGRARRRTWPTGTATRCRASTSPGAPGRACLEPFERRVRDGRRGRAGRAAVPAPGRRADRHRRRGRRRARRGARAADAAARGTASSRTVVGEFALRAPAVIVTVRRHRRQPRPGPRQLAGAARPAAAGADLRGARARRRPDAGASPRRPAAGSSTATGCGTTPRAFANWDPIWARHGIRILPGPSSLWFDARGRRFPRAELPRLRHPRARSRRSPTPATTTPGSCSRRRSSRRSSRSPAPSRTRT